MGTAKTKGCAVAGILLLICVPALSARAADELKQGDTLTVGGRSCQVRTLDTLPYVDSTYATRMIWQKFDDPRLKALREDLRLDNVLLEGKTEFERQLYLLEFVNGLWRYEDPKDQKKTFSPAKIVELNKQEQRFYCEQYACMLSGLAASMGWPCRLVSHYGHTWTEMWSNQYGKWVYMDPTGDRWAAGEDGVPLSVAEVRLKTFTDSGGFPVRYGAAGRERSWRGDKRMAVVGFHPNTNLLDTHFDYTEMYLIVDENSGNRKDVRGQGEPVPDPRVDAHFPINQAALTLGPAADGIVVRVRTMTPSFKAFRCRADDGLWRTCGEAFTWNLHAGTNVLEVKSVNQLEVDGPVSRVEVVMAGPEGAALSYEYLGTPAAEELTKVAGMPALTPIRPAGEPQPEEYEETLKDQWINRWCTTGHWLEWDLQAPVAGEYEVAFYYNTSYYPRRRLEVNGKAAAGLESFVLPSTGSWREWKKVALPVKVALQKGANTLRLTCQDSTYVWLKQMVLSGSGRDIRLEAFDFAREGGGAVQKIFVPRNGSLYNWDEKGHWLQWQVKAPAAGRYRVYLRVAGLNRAVRDMKVNDKLVDPPGRIKVAPTGGWQTWTEIPFGETELRAGSNTIRMENLSGTSMNLNAIRFVGPDGQELLVNAVDHTDEGGGKVQHRR